MGSLVICDIGTPSTVVLNLAAFDQKIIEEYYYCYDE